MSIKEDTVLINNLYTIPELYNDKKIIVDKISKCYFTKSVTPIIQDINPYYNPDGKQTYPIFHAYFKDLGKNSSGMWFTFRCYIDEGFLQENNVAIYLDNVKEGHCLWCGGSGIQELVSA